MANSLVGLIRLEAMKGPTGIRQSENSMLDKGSKDKIIKKFKLHEKDTGSSNIQIAILSEEIKTLTEHLKKHRKDFSSRRGLIGKVNERRALLGYLKKTDPKLFEELTKKLKLKLTFEEPKIETPKEPPAAATEEAAQ